MALDMPIPVEGEKETPSTVPVDAQSEITIAFLDMLPVLAPFFLGFFLFLGLRASFPLYLQVKFGWDELTVVGAWSVISGATMLVGAMSRIPAGLVADRIGRLKAIYLGLGGFLIALIALWTGTTLELYLVGFLIMRIAMNLVVMASRGAVPDVPRGIGIKNGLLASMVALGGLAGPFLLTSILTWFEADSIFLAMFLVIVLDLILFQGIITFSRLKFNPDIARAHSVMLGSKQAQLNLGAARELLSPFVLPSLVLACFMGFINGLVITIQPIFGYYRVNMSFLEIGLLFGISTGLNVVSSPIIGAFSGRAKEKPWVVLSFLVVTTVSLALYLWGQFYLIFVAASLFFTLGINIFLVSDITRIANGTRKEYYSIIFGFDSMLIMMFNALGSIATETLYGISPHVPYLTAALLGIIGLVVSITILTSSPRPADAT